MSDSDLVGLGFAERNSLDALDEYQRMAAQTAAYNGRGGRDGFIYTTMGLAGEAGEILNQAKKVLRGDDDVIHSEESMVRLSRILADAPEAEEPWQISKSRRDALLSELGDALWYIALVSDELGLDLSAVAADNIVKLRARAAAGIIKGDGDKR